MKVLVIGQGGREHALVWKLNQSSRVEQIFVAPGNAGTAMEPNVINVPIAATALEQLCHFALEQRIDLTVVGPEAPLVAGVVDLFQQHGLKIFGPTQFAAQLEGSKAFAKRFMQDNHIPTAAYAVFTELTPALAFIQQHGAPIVIKADGLAAGKGVVVAMSVVEAETAVRDMLGNHRFGDAGARVVIEEFLVGQEVSYMVISDGVQSVPFATSQDHKRRDDGDSGPNTGGMGAYSPAVGMTSELEQQIWQRVIQPSLAGMCHLGHPFVGFLYAGLMITPQGEVRVLEFNVRLGDPETQAILMRLQSDLVVAIEAALSQRLNECVLQWDNHCALNVVLAAAGYPDAVRTHDVITGLECLKQDASCKVFHAGTTAQEQQVFSAGGRILSVAALGHDMSQARDQAYEALSKIDCADAFYRRDIGVRALIV